MRTLVFMLAISAVACGGGEFGTRDGDDDDMGPDASSLTAGAFMVRLADVFCGKAFECRAWFPRDGGVTFGEVYGPDINYCRGLFITPGELQASVDAGRAVFNPSAASACLAGLAALTCPAFWAPGSLPDACDTAVMGTVWTGGFCTIGADCMSSRCTGGVCD